MQQATNGSSKNAAHGDGATSALNGASTNGQSSSGRPPKIAKRDVDVIRLVGQYLQDLGLT